MKKKISMAKKIIGKRGVVQDNELLIEEIILFLIISTQKQRISKASKCHAPLKGFNSVAEKTP